MADMSLDDIIKLNKKKSGNNPRSKKNNNNNSTRVTRNNKKTQLKPNLNRLKGLASKSKLSSSSSSSVQKNVGTMLHVGNLDFNVTDQDIRQLFTDCGHVKKAAVHYDKSGRSLGTAEVIYKDRASALAAINKYGNVPLDGRPMTIVMVPVGGLQRQPPSRVATNTKRSPNKISKKGGGVSKSGSHKRAPKKSLTAEQLDADLETYMKVD